MAQDEEIEAFEQNVGQCSGQGPNQIARTEDARRSQINEARHWTDLMKDRAAMCQDSQQECQDHSFIPSSKASHKPPNKSYPKNPVQGKLPMRSNRVPARAITLHSMQERLKQAQEIVMQSANEPVSTESGRPNTSTDICSPRPIGESGKSGRGRGGGGRGKNTQNIPAATFPTSTQSTQDTSMQSTVPSSAVPLNPTQTCPLRPSAYLPANPPMVTLFRSLTISTCKGCGGFIDRHNFPPGGDLALRLKAVKFFKNPRTGNSTQQDANAYFHMSLDCLGKHNSTLQARHLTMKYKDWIDLTHANLVYLNNLGFLDYIIANRLQYSRIHLH